MLVVIAVGRRCAGRVTAEEASLILVNGKMWTENLAQPIAQAVALDGTTILAVGSDPEIRKVAGAHTRAIDLGGRLLLPGFNDSHVHLLMGGESVITVQLRTADSQAESKERIAQFAKTLPPGAWIRDGVWDHERWHPALLPNHQLIDQACVDHPRFSVTCGGNKRLR
jgi:predicted amidohydrolase YtcJ